MSKIITKNDLDLVIESTLEEAGLVSEESLCEECQGEGCKSCEDRDEFDGRAGEVIGVDSDINKQRMGEDSEGEETYNYGEDEGADHKEEEDLEHEEDMEPADRFKEIEGHLDALKKDMSYDEEHEDRDEPSTHFESVKNNDKLLKEELNKFNKIINYRK